MRFDTDPSFQRIIITGFLLFLQCLLGLVVVQLEEGELPTDIQWFTMLCIASLLLVTYLIEFLKGEDVDG